MGASLNRRALTVGLIGASLASAAPAGAVVQDKNTAAFEAYANSVSTPTRTATPRMTPPNVQRTLRDDADSTRFSSPVGQGAHVESGFSWGDAAFGAGGTLLVLTATGGLLVAGQRRRQRSLSIAG